AGLKCRQAHDSGQMQMIIREYGEGKVEAFRKFALIPRTLRREPIQMIDSCFSQFRKMIAKRTRLGRATARTGDQVPAFGIRDPRPAAARISVNHGSAM